MTSSPSSRCRRRALRAVVVTWAALTGCQGPLRTWRRDDPTLHDLVVTPQPWEQPTTRNGSSSHPATRGALAHNDAQHDHARASKAKSGGRANPYSQAPTSADRRAQSDYESAYEPAHNEDDESPTFEVEDAEIKAMLNDVDPAHRPQMVLIYKALKESLRARADRDEPHDEDPAAQADEVGPAVYSFSDRESEVRPASATRMLKDDGLGNPKTSRADSAHYTLNDHSDEEDVEPQPRATTQPRSRTSSRNPANDKSSAIASTKPHDIKPPAKSRIDRPVVRGPVADTGCEEELAYVAPQRKPRADAHATSSRKHAAAHPAEVEASEEADDHFTDSSAVVQASAESASSGEPSVQPATLRPSARSNAENITKPTAATASAAMTSAATTKKEDPAQENWREMAQRSLRALENEPVDSNETAQLHRHVTKRTMLVLLGQLDQALEPIPNLSAQEQEYFRYKLQALYNAIDPKGHPVLARRWPLVLEGDRNAATQLSAVSNLEVKNAAFCSNVDGFGSITKFPTSQFRPNQEVLLYCEVENFASVKIKDGFETKLRGNYEIVDANQTKVGDFLLPEETDFCTSPRRDYFFVYRIYMPANIAPGRYQLRLSIEDMKGKKFGQTSLDLQIAN